MATYIRKTITLLPWVKLNINKSGMSLSIGPRGAKLNISKKGVYFNTSIPGSGVYIVRAAGGRYQKKLAVK